MRPRRGKLQTQIGVRGLLGGASIRYDAATLAILAQMPPQTTAVKKIYNDFVVSLKDFTIWQDIDLLHGLCGSGDTASVVNLKTPGQFTAIPINSPTFQAFRGWTGNGTSSRLRTQWTPSIDGVNFTLNSAGLWVYSLTNIASGGTDAGNSAAPRALLTTRNASDLLNGDMNNVTAATVSAANTNSIGFFGIQRQSSTDRRLFANGVQAGTPSLVVSTSLPSVEQWICASNSSFFSIRQIALTAWTASLAGKEANFNTASQTFVIAMQAQG